jgi:hypothetical protein
VGVHLQSDREHTADEAPPGAEPEATAPRHAWARKVSPLAVPVGAFLASRVAVTGAIWAVLQIRPDGSGFGVIQRWDSGWYVRAASEGYSPVVPALDGAVNDAAQTTHAFFPLFPGLLRALHGLGLSYLAAGVLVNIVAGLAAVTLLWVLVDDLWGRDAANRAALLFSFFPGTYALSMLYAEGLMLVFSVGCLLALHRRQWVVAGLAGALATASRPNALALVPACAVAAGLYVWRAEGADRRRSLVALAAPVLCPLGAVAFFLFLWRRTGSLSTWFTVQRRGWGQTFDLGQLASDTASALRHPTADVNVTVGVAGLILGIVGLVVLARARPPVEHLVYSAVVLMISTAGNAFLHPRFLLAAVPALAAVAYRLSWPVFSMVLALSATALVALMMLMMATTLVVP